MRIFISYGHDEHAAFAKRVSDELKARGHETWFDMEKLKPGADWERYIEEGLNWVSSEPATGRMLLIMTPHSVGRPGGFCLSELALAMLRRMTVIPAMAVWCEPPLSIARIQWLDMQDCVPVEENNDRFEGRLSQLMDALESREPDFQGTQARLLSLLQPLRYDAELESYLTRFTGRDWVFNRIYNWLADPDASRIFWITGKPGVGKTAIAAWLCHNRREIAAFHLCQHGNTDKSDPRRAVLSIAYQLSTQLRDYQDRLGSMSVDPETIRTSNARALFDTLISQPLSSGFPEPDRKIVVLIDALDEATLNGRNELAEFIASEFHKMPAWMRLIVTSRPDVEVRRPLQAFDPWVLDTDDPANIGDIRTYIEEEIVALNGGRPIPETTVRAILDLSEGVFLYVQHVYGELQAGRLSLDRIDEFPRGLGGVYQRFLTREFPDGLDDSARGLLELVAASAEPLSLAEADELLGWDEYEKKRVLQSFGSLLEIRNGIVRPFHLSLIDWLTDEDNDIRFYVSPRKGHARFAEPMWNDYRFCVSTMSEKAVSRLPQHLAGSQKWAELEQILTDLDFVDAKARAGFVFDLVADYNRALAALPEMQDEYRKEEEQRKEIDTYVAKLIDYSRNPKKNPLPEPPRSVDIKPQAPASERHGDWTRSEKLQAWSHFVANNTRWLGKDIPPAYQLAYNSADSGPVVEAAEKLKLPDREWLRLRNRPAFVLNPGRLRVMQGHTAGILAVAITPDGRMAVSGSFDNSLRLWNLETGECIRIMKGHEGPIAAVALTPDGCRAISGSCDKTLRLWDLGTGECLGVREWHTDAINTVALTPDGRTAVSGGRDKTICVWDLETDECPQILRGNNSEVCVVALTPDGRRALTGGLDNTLHVWDLKTGTSSRLLEGHTGSVYAAVLTPDGRRAVSGSWDTTLRSWDLETGKCLRVMEGHTWSVNAVALTPDGRMAVSGSRDNSVRVWDVETGECVQILEGNTSFVDTVVLTPDGRRALSGSWDRTLCLWNLEAGECKRVLEFEPNTLNTVGCTPDGSRTVLGIFDNTLSVWDVETQTRLWVLEGHTGKVTAVALAPDGRRAVSRSEDKTLRMWDLETGNCLKVLEGHEGTVNDVAFTPDGRRVVSGGWDKTLRVWDVEMGECLRVIEGHESKINALAPSLDGREILSASWDKTLRLWDLETGECLRVIEGHEGTVNAVAFTPDGRRILSGSRDKTLRVWDLETSECLALYATPYGDIFSLAATEWIVVETAAGIYQFLDIENSPTGPTVLTAARLWLFKDHHWDSNLTVLCPGCSRRFVVKDEWLGHEINCPLGGCEERLKINPFVCDNSNWML